MDRKFRRYSTDFILDKSRNEYFDVIVVGTGVAGLFAALQIDPEYKVLVLTKDKVSESNSNLAQGGIAVLLNPEDNSEIYYRDTLNAGQNYNNEKTTRMLIEESTDNIEKLIDLGTNFDKDDRGALLFTREGGHSLPRILHAKDETGKEIIRSLAEEVKKKSNIDLRENVFTIDILTEKEDCCGVIIKENDDVHAVLSRAVILATGGIGQVYKDTTNSVIATGDGIAMAARAGVETMDMEFVQFHPTALYSKGNNRKFLISESLRGEGAVLRDSQGGLFMEKYHESGSLAPRDVVSKAIFLEMRKSGVDHLYLDITDRDPEYIMDRFPNIYETCLKEGIDITKEWIPICPVQHYLMGGIRTDSKGRTNIKGLYACGECACTGVHGANRLASNSLLEGLVFGRKAAEDINDLLLRKENSGISAMQNSAAQKVLEDQRLLEIKDRIRELNSSYVFIIRKIDELEFAERELVKILKELEDSGNSSQLYFEVLNMSIVSYLIINSARKRKESIGSHNIG